MNETNTEVAPPAADLAEPSPAQPAATATDNQEEPNLDRQSDLDQLSNWHSQVERASTKNELLANSEAEIKSAVSSLALKLEKVLTTNLKQEKGYGRLFYLIDNWKKLQKSYVDQQIDDAALAQFFHDAGNLVGFFDEFSADLREHLQIKRNKSVALDGAIESYKRADQLRTNQLFSQLRQTFLGVASKSEQRIEKEAFVMIENGQPSRLELTDALNQLQMICQVYLEDADRKLEPTEISKFIIGLQERWLVFNRQQEEQKSKQNVQVDDVRVDPELQLDDEQQPEEGAPMSNMKIELHISEGLRKIEGKTTFDKNHAYMFFENMISNAQKAFMVKDSAQKQHQAENLLIVTASLITDKDGSQKIQLRIDDNAGGFKSGMTNEKLEKLGTNVMKVDLAGSESGWDVVQGASLPSRGVGLNTQLTQIEKLHAGNWIIGNRINTAGEPIGAVIVVELPIITEN